METLSGLVGLGPHITIGGIQYRMRTMEAYDWALVYERIKSQRPDPIETARRLAKDATPEVQRELLIEAYRDSKKAALITAGELDEWRISQEGLMFAFYLQVNSYEAIHEPQKTDPSDIISEPAACRLFAQMARESLDGFLDEAVSKFPDASREELLDMAMTQEDAATQRILAGGLGWPEKNHSTPETPGTPTSPLTGPDGLPSSESVTAGSTERSDV